MALVGDEQVIDSQDMNAVEGEPQGFQEWSADNVV